jgi:methylmalonyl-CoA mutase cobalamin-binding domain/chain
MSQLAVALVNLKEEEVAQLVQRALEDGTDAMEVLNQCREGMDMVGERYKSGDYFLSELIVSGEIFKDAMKLIEPKLKESVNAAGDPVKMVLATVKGDIHNIGKDIVAVLLKASGFEVHDLGIDVAPKVIVDKLVETNASILGMSGLLTPSFESMKQTIEATEEAGIRDKIKIVIGGGVVTELVQKYTGADAFTDDGIAGVDICKKFAEEMK